MKIEYERVEESNLYQIQTLAQEVWPNTFKEILSTSQIAYMMDMMYSEASLKKQLAKGCEFLIQQKDHCNTGFIAIETFNNNPQTTKIHKIYLLKKYQHQGLGKLLLKKAETIAKANGSIQLQLNVNRFNTNAIAFYKKEGFTITDEEDIAIGNGFLMEDFVMTKLL